MMTTFLIGVAIIAVLLTIWMLVIPAEMVAGAVKALRRGGWKGRRR